MTLLGKVTNSDLIFEKVTFSDLSDQVAALQYTIKLII